MKKLLLLAAVATSALAVNAQSVAPKALMQKVQMQKVATVERQAIDKAPALAAPKKMLADDCFYSQPEGSFFHGFDKEGSGYYPVYVAVAPFTEFAFRNRCSKPQNATWLWVGNEVEEECINADNNFIFDVPSASGYYLPTITNGKAEYTLGFEDNRLLANAPQQFQPAMRSFDEVAPFRANDPHIGTDYIGWGFLDTNFLFGDGKVIDEETDEAGNVIATTNYQCYCVMQEFEKPMTPLYVEDIFMDLEVFDRDYILTDDDILYLDITDLEGNTLYQLTCTKEDVVEADSDEDKDAGEYGTLHFGTAVFTIKEIDPLSGSLASVPFVLDQAFRVYVYGFEGTGVGMRGHMMTDESSVGAFKGYNMVYEIGNPDNSRQYSYVNPLAVPMSFSAFFDQARVWENAFLQDGTELTDFNVLEVSADGSSIKNVGYPEFEFVYVDVACNWFDADDNEMYYLADAEGEVVDWCFAGVDNSAWVDYDPETETPGPTCYVTIECDPLEDGVEGRGAKLYVYGRGIKSEQPIYVLQGNYTKEQCDADEYAAGIGATVVNTMKTGTTYNLAGQQVNSSYRGIVVKNGVKMLQK